MSYIQGSFAGRWDVMSQSNMYSPGNCKVVSFGATYKIPSGRSISSYSTFRGSEGISVLNTWTAEPRKCAYLVEDYKISWSSDVMSYGTGDYDSYRMTMRICTFRINQQGNFDVVAVHDALVLNTLPNQVLRYEGKLPIAVVVYAGDVFGVRFVVERVLGTTESISTATFNMICHVTCIDDTMKSEPYPDPL